jgi:hypothetical protein
MLRGDGCGRGSGLVAAILVRVLWARYGVRNGGHIQISLKEHTIMVFVVKINTFFSSQFKSQSRNTTLYRMGIPEQGPGAIRMSTVEPSLEGLKSLLCARLQTNN